uniref:Selenoprotein N n=1 Tax=Latimeria chalumnae TaxID=7897 RepID=H3A241_LATCH
MESSLRQRAAREERTEPEPEPEPSSVGGVRRLFAALLVLFAAVGVKYLRDVRTRTRQEEALKSLGNEGLFLFSSLDTDNDLFLSPEEFKPIAEKLMETGLAPVPDFEEDEVPDPSGESLTVVAKFQPLLLETMTKSKDGFLGVSHHALDGLQSWRKPQTLTSVFFARQFKAFLPPKNKLEVGDPWWVVPSELNIFTGYLSNNRFYPALPKGKEVIIHNLLSMFHPRPFVKTRFGPQGAVACIRAVSDFYYDIIFRIHSEFQLNEPPGFPFWFSPAQFTGHIVLSKDSSHVREFRLFVPNNRSLNVDMEWLYGTSENSNMEVDIGYLPQMELELVSPSVPTILYDEEGNVIDSQDSSGEPIQFVFEEIKWQSEISWEEAARRLEITMYPFKKVPYLPFTEAFHRAKAENKLVHSILLWGALDDQSCFSAGSGRTLRETVLESSPVLALLSENFISSWSLVKELEILQNNEENELLAKQASLHLEKYNFPVEMMLCFPNGTVVHHMNANYFLDITSMKPEEMEGGIFSFSAGFEDPSTAMYLKFLKEGLEKAKMFLQP